MLTDKQAKLVRQTFYTPLRMDGSHEMMHIVHDTNRGVIYRVYTDNYITKSMGHQQEFEALPKAGEFTTTTPEFRDVMKEAEQGGYLNKPLSV